MNNDEALKAMKVRTWMKEGRRKRNYSQRKLANVLFVSQSAVNAYESGERNPQLSTIIKIAAILDVDIKIALEHELKLNNLTVDQLDR